MFLSVPSELSEGRPNVPHMQGLHVGHFDFGSDSDSDSDDDVLVERRKGEEERYQILGVEEALHRSQLYPYACKELAFLLRHAYSKLPKALQSLLFNHSLTAFRLLPTQGNSGTSAANLLVQASEAALPKQRKSLAVSEFKRAIIAHKRRLKRSQDGGGLVQLPNDVLIHVFSFLDLQSLVRSRLVSRSWKIASSDEILWRSQYFLFFGKNEVENFAEDSVKYPSNDDSIILTTSCWRQAFTRKVTGKSWKLGSGRGYCGNCFQIFWLSEVTPSSPHRCVDGDQGSENIMPILPSKVVEYLLEGSWTPGFSSRLLRGIWTLGFSSSDSDSDSDGVAFHNC